MSTNWAQNFTYSASDGISPTSTSEVQDLVAQATRVKALGTRHSFNNGADTEGLHIDTSGLNGVLGIDRERMTVRVLGGIRYGELSSFLVQEGLALHNLASLPHISVAGAVATATHGSGVGNGNLATAVRSIEIVDGEGSARRFQIGDPLFDGVVVNIGALGIVTELELAVQPTFDVRQVVYQNLPLSAADGAFEEIMGSAYSVSFFTTWRSESIDQVWQKHVGLGGDPAPTFHGATSASRKLHPLPDHPAESCTEQLGVPGSWHERLAHFKLEFTPSSGDELQSEFMIPCQYSFAALTELAKIREQIAPVLHVSEIRTAAADTLWMSPACGQDVTCIHFTWRKDWARVRALLPTIESLLGEFGAIPHWGKLFLMDSSVIGPRVKRFDEFKKLVRAFDPSGKFRNGYLDQVLGS